MILVTGLQGASKKMSSMKRRDFFQKGALTTAGISVLGPVETFITPTQSEFRRRRRPRNIIFLVSDGMSAGTLNMADLLCQRKEGRHSHWLQLYRDNRITRALMDMASLDSAITDSAAASSSWGGGVRVNNGSLNVGPNGELHQPILRKFKAAGKAVGCVTTVPITHATPAGFCINNGGRGNMEQIALQYLPLRFDVMMGGGAEVFNKEDRKDKRDVLQDFRAAGYQVLESKKGMAALKPGNPVLGVFHEGGLPYSTDHQQDDMLKANVPTLAEMTATAIQMMQGSDKGFVLQVEGGKVDWAAHANDVAGLLYDQLAFDDAVKVAIDFAEKDKNTLVVITTDHGNANPGLIKGSKADKNFEKILSFRHSNDWILQGVEGSFSADKVIERIQMAQGIAVTTEEAQTILKFYTGPVREDGLYNPRQIPFKPLADMQVKHTSVGWASTDHTADFVELAMFGPGSEQLNPFIKNTELHQMLLEVSGVGEKMYAPQWREEAAKEISIDR